MLCWLDENTWRLIYWSTTTIFRSHVDTHRREAGISTLAADLPPARTSCPSRHTAHPQPTPVSALLQPAPHG